MMIEVKAAGPPNIPTSSSAGDGLGVRAAAAIWAAAILGVSLALLANRDTLNHDAASYISLARHYLHGRFDLAIVGPWSPLFVWLVAALIGLVGDPVLAARLAMGVSALVFVSSGIAVARLLPTRLTRVAAAATTAGLGVVAAGALITPDLLSAGIYAFACVMLLRAGERPSMAVAAGALFGLGYLAKAIVLPAAVVVSGLLSAALARAGRQEPRQAVLRLALCLVGLTVVALPWVSVLSAKYGQLTFTTAHRAQHALSGPPSVREHQPTDRMFVVPEAGRQSQFEDESVLPMRAWSPFDNVRHAAYSIRRAAGNVRVILRAVNEFDLLGIGLIAAIFLFTQFCSNTTHGAAESISVG